MIRRLNRLGDRMLNRLVPQNTARAQNCRTETSFCYCSGGLAYRRVCTVCPGGVGRCSACSVTGTC
ncbi:hypothetical protein FB566_2399 [Stackebrandtia endophytica]|uniref:Uncharacterized protein n=1 Tax=Stackebrandtia endophytica TaxID=1496996 RepID=A0A543AW95_9ACTN|nr:hypothetical protein [Stackebrandtia endophytica]TQL76857.1 hypothetical protein FB566_2399 [Stackebrandtia endophytica]